MCVPCLTFYQSIKGNNYIKQETQMIKIGEINIIYWVIQSICIELNTNTPCINKCSKLLVEFIQWPSQEHWQHLSSLRQRQPHTDWWMAFINQLMNMVTLSYILFRHAAMSVTSCKNGIQN